MGTRKLVVSEFLTLDGVMEDPGGAEKFERGPEGDKFKVDELAASDAFLPGRLTYQAFAAAWPSRTGDFADRMNGTPKYVVSTTLKKAEWNNSKLIKRDLVKEVSKLKAMPGKDILVAGSGRLVRTLIEHNLVDELRLMVFPVILGKGKRLFEDENGQRSLKLIEARPVGTAGVITLVYHPERKP